MGLGFRLRIPSHNLCGDSSATARFNRNPFCNYYCGWLKWTVLVVRDSSNCHQFHAISYFICECRQNQSLAELGQNFGTVQMLDQFATIGGAGCTIGLAIAMAIVGHSSRMKAMSKISFVPAFFNINEPLIFGLPVIFNPLLLIPIAVAPIVSVLIAFLSMKIGFMPMFTNIQAPWATPFLFSGF